MMARPLGRWAERCFALGIILSAVLLPLEIIPNRAISTLSALVTLLLLPYAVVAWRRLLERRWALLFALPLGAAWLPLALQFGAMSAGPSLRTFSVLVARAWIVATLANKRHLELFERSTYWVAGVVVMFGVYQYLGDIAGLPSAITFLKENYSSSGTYAFPRVHSFAREPLLLANYLFIPLGLLIMRFIGGVRLPLAIKGLFLATLGLILTLSSRGAFLALGAITVVIIFTSPKSRLLIRRYARWLLLTLAASLLLVGGSTQLARGSWQSYFRHTFESQDSSFTNRTQTWSKSLKLLADSPITGVGLGNSSAKLSGTSTKLPDGPVFNNTYLTAGTELGWLGILGFVPLGLALIRLGAVSVREHFIHPVAAYGIIVMAYAVQLATYEGLLNLRLWAVLALAIAAYRLYNEAHYEDRH